MGNIRQAGREPVLQSLLAHGFGRGLPLTLGAACGWPCIALLACLILVWVFILGCLSETVTERVMWTSTSSQVGPQLRLVLERTQYANAPSAVQGEASYLPPGQGLTGVAGPEISSP